MVNMSKEQLQGALQRRHNVRNMAVIAHVDHGKTTLTDSLLAKAGVIASAQAGDKRATDTRKDEQEKGITIKSTAISLYYTLAEKDASRIPQREGPGFLINLVDSPGHVDFSPEVTAALRLVDGAMVVVDCVSGVSVQTETVLRQALSERIKPVLMMNKLDRAIFEKALSHEEVYRSLSSVLENTNALLATYSEEDGPMGDLTLDPAKGNVAFGSGLHGWGFNLRQFARLYAKKFGVKEERLMRRLWGENYFDPATRQWGSERGEGKVRGFDHFVLEPLVKVLKSASAGDKDSTRDLLGKLGINLTSSDLEHEGKEFMRVAMKAWLPVADAMLDMIVTHLPSPVTAQAYRTEMLYEGPMDDEVALGMKSCDPAAPVMMYISKMVPSTEKGRFYAVGRLFSGTLQSGQKVRIMGPDYDPGAAKKRDLYVKNIPSVVLMMGGQIQSLGEACCGAIVGLVGVDRYLQKTGTVTTWEGAHNLKVMKFSVSPVMRVAVNVVRPSDLAKLVEGLRRLNKAEPLVQYTFESGEHIVAGAGELHLEICLKDLEEMYAGVPIKKSQPVVRYCETVTEESPAPYLAKSVNGLNKLLVEASPMDKELCLEIERGELSQDVKERAAHLAQQYGFDPKLARKLWSLGPNTSGPNILLDATEGIDPSTIRDSVVGGFQWVTEEGPLCGEPMRGVQLSLKDAVIHSDPAHRGGGQIIPTARRAFLGAVMSASPALLEPVYLAEVQCPVACLGSVMSVVTHRRGQIVEQIHHQDGPLCTLKAYLPVMEAFGFSEELKSQTSGQAFPQCFFDHWQVLPGDPLTPGSKAAEVVTSVRQRKGMPASLPVF